MPIGRWASSSSRRGKEPYFKNTLFVLVGDHGFSVAPILTELRLLRFHVPLLFYAPDCWATQDAASHSVASQNDVIPTVLGLLGVSRAMAHWGRDLFAVPCGRILAWRTSSPARAATRSALPAAICCWSAAPTAVPRLSLQPRVSAACGEAGDRRAAELKQMRRDAQAYVTAAGAAWRQDISALSTPSRWVGRPPGRLDSLERPPYNTSSISIQVPHVSPGASTRPPASMPCSASRQASGTQE